MSVFTTSRAIRVASAGVVQRSSTAISSSRRVSLSSVASSALRFHCRAASSVVQNGSGNIRFQSSATATAEAPGCPHAAAASKSKQLSTQADIDVATAVGCPVHSTKPGGPSSNDHPELVEVPSLPFVGSLVRSYSNIPPLDKPYTFWPEMRKKYGDFYSMGMPGLGNPDDSKNTVYIVQDPKEMMKVLRSEGSLPSGMAQSSWAIAKWERDAGFEIVSHDDGGFLGQGENWKRIRTFMQTDLLHPTAARGYADGIIEAAELASKGAPASSKDMNAFFERCAFDMFSTVMFGHNMECADPNTSTDLEDLEFVRAAKIGLGTSGAVSRSLRDAIFVKTFGIETEQFRKMKENLDLAWKIGSDKIERFLERREKRELSEREKKSYLFRAMERYEQGSSGVSLQEAKEMSWGGIFAAVDTTSGKMGWNVLHAALNPGVQERLYKEISTATSSNGGRLTPEILDRSKTPFLHAFVRESHRLTPVVPIATRKRVASDNLTIHGVTLPRGSAVACDGFSLGQDPSYVDEPRSFRPERWLDDAVASRKGTPKELIDHPFFKGPFSQGARNCPGSRVALNEVTVILSQLLLDYRISAPGVSSLDDVAYAQHTVLEPRMPSLHFEPRA